MSLLEMAGPGAGGHVLEHGALDVLEHQVEIQAFVGHVAGAEVEIEESVVIDVPEIRAHRRAWRGRGRPAA